MCALHEAIEKYGSLPEAFSSLDFDAVKITTIELTDGVAMLMGLGGNVAVGDGVVLVDDAFAALADKIKIAVKALSPEPIRTVINTHWHVDHSNGNASFGEGGARIIAHANARQRLADGQRVEFAGVDFPPVSGPALPSQTYLDEIRLQSNGDTIRVVHVPNAHTDGDTVVKWERANVLHMGDVYVRYGLPFIDIGSKGSLEGVIAGVERGLALSDEATHIIPGHGDLATRADLLAYGDGLRLIADEVAQAKSAGRSLQECQESVVIEGWPRPEAGFIQEVLPKVFVEFAWSSP